MRTQPLGQPQPGATGDSGNTMGTGHPAAFLKTLKASLFACGLHLSHGLLVSCNCFNIGEIHIWGLQHHISCSQTLIFNATEPVCRSSQG